MKNSGLVRKYLLVVLLSLGMIALLGGWSATVQSGPWSSLPRILMGAIIFLTGPCILFIKKREARISRGASEDGVEKKVAIMASSAVFYDTLVLLTAFGASYAIFGSYIHPALMTVALLVIIFVDFVIRHSIFMKRIAE